MEFLDTCLNDTERQRKVLHDRTGALTQRLYKAEDEEDAHLKRTIERRIAVAVLGMSESSMPDVRQKWEEIAREWKEIVRELDGLKRATREHDAYVNGINSLRDDIVRSMGGGTEKKDAQFHTHPRR